MIDQNTRVVAISAVQYASGFKADLERIGRCRKERWMRCLWSTSFQALGACAFDLARSIRRRGFGCQSQVLCSPEGCGFIYLSDRARERVKPTLVGWISVGTPWDFNDREQPWRSTALAWESGTGCSALSMVWSRA